MKIIAALSLFFAFVACAPLEEITKSVSNDISTFDPPPGYVNVGKRQYYVHASTPANWHASWLECRRRDGYLASFRDRVELSALNAHLEKIGMSDRRFWVGGNSLAALKNGGMEGYAWFNNGHSVALDLFSPGKPDALNGCLQLTDVISRSLPDQPVEYLLTNEECNKEALFICQLEGAKISVTVV